MALMMDLAAEAIQMAPGGYQPVSLVIPTDPMMVGAAMAAGNPSSSARWVSASVEA